VFGAARDDVGAHNSMSAHGMLAELFEKTIGKTGLRYANERRTEVARLAPPGKSHCEIAS
jgi:hypothetical protein